MASDRLSELPDDLLIRILSFVPVKEAASTTLLSRRWRNPLWLETGTFNVDLTSEQFSNHAHNCLAMWRDEGDAREALRRDRRPRRLKKLSVTVTASRDDDNYYSDFSEYLNPFVFHGKCVRMLRNVEELRLECQIDAAGAGPLSSSSPPRYTYAMPGPEYNLRLHHLPCEDFRVLHLTGCSLKEEIHLCLRNRIAYPCLTTLRLRRCTVPLGELQRLITAAPALADVCLESVTFPDQGSVGGMTTDKRVRLHCPAVTAFAMVNCHMFCRSFELDAPALICFRYAQISSYEQSISLKPPAPFLEKANLESISGTEIFRSLLHDMCHVKVLKLTVYSIVGDIKFERLPCFPNLKHLVIEELCGFAMGNGSAAAAATAIGELLQRCPVIRELWIRFSSSKYLHESPDLAGYLESMACRFDESDYCDRCAVSAADRGRQELNDCWKNSLRKVTVQFQKGKLTCSQVELVMFLVENAAVLEEFDIDGESQDVTDQINTKIATWRARSSSSREKEAHPAGVGAERPTRRPPPQHLHETRYLYNGWHPAFRRSDKEKVTPTRIH
uniref:F-box domain-containing protein n=1 Tax=Oryza barthii TaxID=65489 RepID=A0A0D3GZ16_9ORYZ